MGRPRMRVDQVSIGASETKCLLFPLNIQIQWLKYLAISYLIWPIFGIILRGEFFKNSVLCHSVQTGYTMNSLFSFSISKGKRYINLIASPLLTWIRHLMAALICLNSVSSTTLCSRYHPCAVEERTKAQSSLLTAAKLDTPGGAQTSWGHV